jgi:hypothetical protein
MSVLSSTRYLTVKATQYVPPASVESQFESKRHHVIGGDSLGRFFSEVDDHYSQKKG